MRTGILGGTFDPIHFGHLAIGSVALDQQRLDQMLVIPAGDPWQKADRPLTPARQRLEMCRLAVGPIDRFEVDDREIERAGPTYTIDTIESLDDDHDLFLVLGADAALGLPTWHRFADVVSRVEVLVVPRAGVYQAEVAEVVPDAVFLEMEPVAISGTEIRERVRIGRPYRSMVPKLVAAYIEEHALYTERGEADMVGGPQEAEETP